MRVTKPDAEFQLPQVSSSTPVYQGRIVNMRVDELLLSNGARATREVVDHPGAVVIVAVDEDEQVYLVRQYRHAIRRILLEFPAGTLEPGELPLETAKRELREEVGLVARAWSPLGSFYSSPGFLNEKLDVFLAKDLTQEASSPDFDEELTIVRMPLSQLCLNIGEVQDAKTLAALQLLQEGSSHGKRC